MNCENIQDLFQLYIDGKLDAATKLIVEEHIKHCDNCSQFLSEFKDTTRALGGLSRVDLPEDFYANLNLKISGAKKEPISSTKWLFRPVVYVPAFCAFVLVVCLGRYMNIHRSIPVNNVKLEEIIVSSSKGVELPAPGKIIGNSAKINEMVQSIESKRTIEIAKLPDSENKQFILRGAGARVSDRKIIRQWQGIESAIKEKQSLLVNDRGQWQKMWNDGMAAMKPEPVLPELDFAKNKVVAVFMGEQRTGGYNIKISQIQETDENVYIDVVETLPKQGAEVAQHKTSPYHIVVIEKD